MLKINDTYRVRPEEIKSIQIDDRHGGHVYIYISGIGSIQVKKEYGESVYQCADRIQKAIEEG